MLSLLQARFISCWYQITYNSHSMIPSNKEHIDWDAHVFEHTHTQTDVIWIVWSCCLDTWMKQAVLLALHRNPWLLCQLITSVGCIRFILHLSIEMVIWLLCRHISHLDPLCFYQGQEGDDESKESKFQ